MLEGTEQQLASVLLVVGAVIVIAHHWQARGHNVHRLGDDVEMFTRVQRHGDADAGGDLPRPHAAGQHHMVGGDIAGVRAHTDGAAIIDQDLSHLGLLEDLHAAVTRALGHGLGDADRIGLTIGRNENTADQIVHIHDRVMILAAVGPQHVDPQAEHLGHVGAAHQILHAARVGRQRQRPVHLIADGLPRLFL